MAAFGASAAVFTNFLCLLASPKHETLFHWHGSAAALFVPAFSYLFLLSFVFALLLLAVRKTTDTRRVVWSGFLFLLPLVIAKSVAAAIDKAIPHKANLIALALCGSLFLISSFWLKPPAFERIREVGHALMLAAAFSGAILVLEDAACWIQARHLTTAAVLRTPVSVPGHHLGRRVIWLVLDELAYKQLYVHRPRDLSLPAFDGLRAQSTVFTNVVPAADHTEVALPSLLTGNPITDVASPADGQRLLMKQQNGQWVLFDEHRSIFADAQSAGYNAAIAGWYIPYCRMLPSVVQNCFWSSQYSHLRGLFPGDTVAENILHPLVRLWRKSSLLHSNPAKRAFYKIEESEHIQDYVALKDASDQLLIEPQYDFVLLHLPVPHPDGIYDRHRQTFTVTHSSYVDNLALADLYLAHLRQVLENTHQWDDTTLVIMGDHSWRTKMLWKGGVGWGPEDEQASENSFDSRPAYIVKLPHQETPATVDTRFHSVRTRALLNQFMQGHLQTPEELQQWAKE